MEMETSASEASRDLKRSLTIKQIKLMLHWWATIPDRDVSSFFFFMTLQYKSQSFATRLVRVDGSSNASQVVFKDAIHLENVDPGFTIEARVFCYTYTDPEKLDAQRRITTPQKALERLTQVARNTAKNTPQTLRRLKRRIISRIHGRSRSSSRGPSTPDRVVPAARIEKDFILVCPKSCLFWRLLFYKSRATCSFLGLTGCL
eukprot:m.168762 g.168762  ORF g.168762 m.168762 type:complete len:203 (-) comp16467_c0_seq55:1468-2076(-)